MFVRDFTMARGGVALADRYAPRDLTPRVPMDASIATLENGQLRQGMEIMPNKDQNHMVHAGVHLSETDQLIASTDMADPESVLANGPQIVNLNAHTAIHMQFLNQSLPDSPVVRELNKRLQNAEGTSVNIMRRAEKIQQEMAEAQAEMGGMDPMAGPTPEQEAQFQAAAMDVAETQARMDLQRAEAEQSMAIRQMDADMTLAERQQKMALNDSETAVKLLMKRLETDAKVEAQRQQAKAKASQRKTA